MTTTQDKTQIDTGSLVEAFEEISLAEISSKYGDKADFWDLVHGQLDKFCPAYRTFNVKHLANVLLQQNGQKTITNAQAICKEHRHFKKLRIESLLKFINEQGLNDYLPQKGAFSKYDRNFLLTICQTVAPGQFKALVNEAISDSLSRKSKQSAKGQKIRMPSDTVKAIRSSNTFSTKRNSRAWAKLAEPKKKAAKANDDEDAHMKTANASPLDQKLKRAEGRLAQAEKFADHALQQLTNYQSFEKIVSKLTAKEHISTAGKIELQKFYASLEATPQPDKTDDDGTGNHDKSGAGFEI